MRLLFVKEELTWPRTSGHDVHTYYMMSAIQRLGHEVGLVTRRHCAPEALAGIELKYVSTLDKAGGPRVQVRLSWLQQRFRSYWGVEQADLETVAAMVEDFQPDVLVAVGLDGLPYVAAAGRARALWYAADEWFLHHLSLTEIFAPSTWSQLHPAAVKLLYERSFAGLIDRTWVVSDADRRTMRWCAGMRNVDVLPNGVDGNYFAPTSIPTRPRSCVFWGRLDFEPNIDALQWFVQYVWPKVRSKHPDAVFRIIGANPNPDVLKIGAMPGIDLHADVPDLRSLVREMGVAVMPFHSGGGIKNKILEAAAMAKPVLCTKRALGGLRSAAPFVAQDGAEEWIHSLSLLWSDSARTEHIGRAGREWVMDTHTWDTTARSAMEALQA